MGTFTGERRRHLRRPMEIPAVFVRLEDNNMPGNFFLGHIRDASIGGLKVVMKKKDQFEKGDRFLIYVYEVHKTPDEPAIPVQIKAELVWQDRELHTMGMKTTNFISPF